MKFTNSNKVIAFDHENNSRVLTFEIEEDLRDCDIYIDFELTDGSKYKTARLTNLNNYYMPNTLLEYCGQIKAQLVAYKGDNFIQKSRVAYFNVESSINASQEIIEQSGDILESLENGKADGLSYANNKLQLTANGALIGEEVEIDGETYQADETTLTLDDTTFKIKQTFINNLNTSLDLKVDKVTGKGLSTNDYTNVDKQAVGANTSARHTHANKTVLDNTTASYTTQEKTRLAGLNNYDDTEVRGEITAEATRAAAAEATNANAITAEAQRARAAEQANATNLTNEITRATTAEQTNATNIANEITRATAAEGINATAIAAETTRAQGVENEMIQALSDIADVWEVI